MKMRNTTLLAFQAAIAVAIAEMIDYILPLDKGYWITLTAMALSVQTWGESIKKAVERVVMTILGGSVGTLIYFFLPPDVFLLFLMLMTFVFLAVYLIPINHQLGVFFITAFVVFLFAIIAQWNVGLLGYRIIDTLIGALIALLVSYLFAGKTVKRFELMINHWERLLAMVQSLADSHADQTLPVSTQALYENYVVLRNHSLMSRYEMLFHRYNRRQFFEILNKTGLITQNLALLESTQSWYGHKLEAPERESLNDALSLTIDQIKQMILSMQTKQPVEFRSIRPLLNQVMGAIRKDPKRFLVAQGDGFVYYQMMYYLYRVNVRIIEAGDILAGRDREKLESTA